MVQLDRKQNPNIPMQLNKLKTALSLLRNNKSENPHIIQNEFLKHGGEVIAILLKDCFKQILQSEDI